MLPGATGVPWLPVTGVPALVGNPAGAAPGAAPAGAASAAAAGAATPVAELDDDPEPDDADRGGAGGG